MADVRRDQSAVSLSSCFLPALVSLYTLARREFCVRRHSASSHPPRSSRCNAVRSEPGLTLKTPRDICSMRRAIPKPCIGSRLSVLRISMSSVPWITSVFGSSIDAPEKGVQSRIVPIHHDCQDVMFNWKNKPLATEPRQVAGGRLESSYRQPQGRKTRVPDM